MEAHMGDWDNQGRKKTTEKKKKEAWIPAKENIPQLEGCVRVCRYVDVYMSILLSTAVCTRVCAAGMLSKKKLSRLIANTSLGASRQMVSPAPGLRRDSRLPQCPDRGIKNKTHPSGNLHENENWPIMKWERGRTGQEEKGCPHVTHSRSTPTTLPISYHTKIHAGITSPNCYCWCRKTTGTGNNTINVG